MSDIEQPQSSINVSPTETVFSNDTQNARSSIQDRKRARRLSINNREMLIAAIDSNLEKVDNLIKSGVDINFKDRDGNTPLHWAVESGDFKVVQHLLIKGAIANNKNNKDETPIDISKRINRQDIIQILESSLESESHTLPQYIKFSNERNEYKFSDVLNKTQHQNNDVAISTEKEQEKIINPVHGNIYQLKVLTLFLYRGVSQQYSFRLGTEIEEAKQFDDLVFEYKQGGRTIYRLLQAKHRLDETKKINAGSLLTENDEDFSLIKYFFSYQESKKEKLLKDGLIKDVTICTNIDFDIKHLESKNIGVERIVEKDDILDVKSNTKESARYKFTENIISLLKPKLQSYSLAKLYRTTEYSDNEIRDYLKHLVFAVNQPNEEELDCIVKKEISKEFDFINVENVYNQFFIKMLNWLQGKERGMFLSYEEGKVFFEEINRGIHFWFGVKNPIDSFTGRSMKLDDLHRILHEEDKRGASQFVCISGLGGVGKSEFVRKYISQYSEEYHNKVVWINAESYQTLADSFRRLAYDQLKFNTKNANNEEKKINSIVEDVYTFFSNRKCLFIFDNAEKYKYEDEFDHGIERFLPVFPPNSNKLHVLITSRNKKWPKNVQVLPLSVFNQQEAIEFIKKSLNLKDDVQEKDIKEFANQLQCFPLALQQAVAYIRTHDEKLKNIGSKFEICDYLEKYKEKTKDFLNFKFPEDTDSHYTKTIYSTWNVTLDAIRQKENGSYACEILNILSYFAPADIPTCILINLVNDVHKLASAIELLKQYSMVHVENTTLYLHRLVLQITRLHLQDKIREEEVLLKALKLFDRSNLNSENVDHAISLWNHSCKYSKIVEEFAPLTNYISLELFHSARYEEVRLFGIQVSKVLSDLPSTNLRIVDNQLATQNSIAHALLSQGKYDTDLKDFQEMFLIKKRIFGPSHPETLVIQTYIAATLTKQGKLNKALKLNEEIVVIQERILGKNHPITLSTRHNIATIFINQGRFSEALQLLQEVLNSEETIYGKNHLNTLDTKSSIAEVLMNNLSKNSEALQMFQEICSIQETAFKKNHPRILNTKSNIAEVLLKQGKYSDALQVYREVWSIKKMIFEENHPSVLACQFYIAESLRGLGKYDESLKVYRDVFKKQKQSLGSEHPDTLYTQFGIAQTLDSHRKYSEALQLYQQILNKSRITLGNDHPISCKVLNCIAIIYTMQGEHDTALQYYQEVLEIQNRSLGEDHPDNLSIKSNIGQVFYNKKQYDQALQIYQDCFDKSEKLLPNHPDSLRMKNNIALVLLAQKNYNKALRMLREVLDTKEATLGKEHFSCVTTKNNIVSVLLEQGKHSDALKLLREVSKSYNEILGSEHPDSLRVSNEIQSISLTATTLLNAVKINDFRKLENLIKNGVDVNTNDDDDITLLHYAVNNSNINIIKTLLKNGAEVTEITNKGYTPLHIASSKCDNRIIDILLQHVNPDKLSNFVNAKTTSSGTTALHMVAKNGSLNATKSILKYGAIYNIKNNQGEKPLDLSTDCNIIRILKLVEQLFEYATKGNMEIVNQLKAMKSDELEAMINARNSQGYKLLIVAHINKHTNVSTRLLEIMKSYNSM